MKTMHLFAGAGGGLLADLILGHEPVIAVEWEPYACQVLRERAEDGWFPGLQVWEGDVRLFDPSEYKGKVDCIHAGFPCQDISCAGNQAGIGEGTRSGLYREVLRIADVVRPRFLFLENVSAITSIDDGGALRTVAGDLAERGFDAVWCCLSAAEVGANNGRDRWWLLANARGFNMEVEAMVDKGCLQKQSFRDSMPREIQALSRKKDQLSMVGADDDDACWVDRSKGIGNAQNPLQAATAFSILWQMMEAANEQAR